MSIYLKINTDLSGPIPVGRSLLNSHNAGTGDPTTFGTAVSVPAGSITTSGSGTGLALSIRVDAFFGGFDVIDVTAEGN